MPYKFDEVKPGFLIKARSAFELQSYIQDIDLRLSRLEAVIPTTGKVAIDSATPLSLKVGDTLHLIGRNFGIPQQNSISFDGTPVAVTFVSPSNDGQLSFLIPAFGVLPSAGKDVTVSLSSPNGFASAQVHISPGQAPIPTAQLFVAMSAPPNLPVLGTGVPLVFEFTVTGSSSLADSYTVSAKVDAGWSAVLAKDATGTPASPSEVQIPQANAVNVKFLIAVNIPAGTANNTIGNLSVSVTSKLNPTGANGASTPLALSVNNPPPNAQDNVIITVQNVFPPATMVPPGATVGGIISIAANNTAQRVDLAVKLKSLDTYDVSVKLDNPTGWTINAIPATIPATSTTPVLTLQMIAAAPGAGGATPAIMTVKLTSRTNAGISGSLPQSIRPV